MSDESDVAPALPVRDDYDDVRESTVSLRTREGTAPAFLFRPRTVRPGPAVVLAAEAYGVNAFTRRVAATLAHRGYATLVPDYFRGDGPRDPENYTDITEVVQCISRLDFRRATLDVIAAIEHLEHQPFVLADRVAVWGYCTGGTLAMLASALRPELAAAVLFFPSQPVFEVLDARHPVHPIDLLWNVHCPLLLIYGDQDPVMSLEQLAELGERLAGWGIRHTINIYPGAGHAFSAPVGPLRHDPSDRAAWADALQFLAQSVNR